MKRFRLVGVVVLAMSALGVVIVSGAQAESAPYWSITGTRLAAGKTHNGAGHGIRAFELITNSTGANITCQNVTVEKGVLLGSEPGNEGTTTQINAFSGCNLQTGNGAPNCHLAATEKGAETTTITTNPLRSELVENVEGGKGGKKLEVLRGPATGSKFVTIFFAGSGCEVFADQVTGKTAAEIVTDPGEESIELGKTPASATSFIIRFPSTAITEVWLVTGGTGKIVKVEQQSFTNTATQHGTALALLANSQFEPETTKWSPLP